MKKIEVGDRIGFTVGPSTLFGEVVDVLNTIVAVRLTGTSLRTNFLLEDMVLIESDRSSVNAYDRLFGL